MCAPSSSDVFREAGNSRFNTHQAAVFACQEMDMGWVARFRIGARLAVGFGLMLLLIAGLIGSSYVSLQHIGTENRQLIEQELAKVAAVAVIDTATRANGLATTELLLVAPEQVPGVQARIAANRTRIDEALQTLERLVTRPEGRASLDQLKTARQAYVASFGKVPPLVLAGQLDQARQLVRDETLPALGRLQAPIDTLRQLQETMAQAHGQAVTRLQRGRHAIHQRCGHHQTVAAAKAQQDRFVPFRAVAVEVQLQGLPGQQPQVFEAG